MNGVQTAGKFAERDLRDQDFINRALDQAKLNLLRMAMQQATGYPELATIATIETGKWTGRVYHPSRVSSNMGDAMGKLI